MMTVAVLRQLRMYQIMRKADDVNNMIFMTVFSIISRQLVTIIART